MKRHNFDIEYMPPVVAAVQRQAKQSATIILSIVILFFVIAFLWAAFTKIDEVTRGEGKVIASSETKKISHLEGGIVREILVSEGDIVQKNQTLLTIDNTVAEARYREGKEQYYQDLAKVARLQAQIDDKDYKVPPDVTKNAPHIAESSVSAFKAWKEKLENEQKIAKQEVAQRQAELAELQTNLNQYEQSYKLSKEELDLTEPLMKKGIVSKVEYIRMQRDTVDAKGKLDAAQDSIRRITAALSQAKDKETQVALAYKSDARKELSEAKYQLSEIQKQYTADSDRIKRTDIRSPVRGTVKVLHTNTIGGVIQPGQDLIEITPLEDTLLVEAQIRPADIAFLRVGLPAMVKISAYDFSIYGGLEGTLEVIGSDTVTDEKQNSFYKLRVRTKKNYLLNKNGEEMPIIPGMVATVDILTGKKSILDYLLKPILKAKHSALRER